MKTATPLIWQAGIPRSPHFDDVYYSREDGLAESQYVFLEGNQLPERLPKSNFFRIAETGFGTGLNFLATWQLWQRCRPTQGWLHFESIEGFPLCLGDLRQVHAKWPALAEWSAQLLPQQRSNLEPLPARQEWPTERISLTLYHEEVLVALRALPAQRFDAWFLDGFSPSKNPGMWTQDVLQEVARTTRPGGTCATFTAAGHVRRSLEDSGFSMHKIKGFARKREMLHGCKP